ncbi:MAG: hypothetical protein AAF989_06470 [Planctomycetota bacterium]
MTRTRSSFRPNLRWITVSTFAFFSFCVSAEQETPAVSERPIGSHQYGEVFGASADSADPRDQTNESIEKAAIVIGSPSVGGPTRLELQASFPDRWEAVDLAIARLSGNDFTERERATSDIHAMGFGIVPLLRYHKSRSDDPEVSLRLASLLSQLENSYREFIERSFMTDPDASLPGWGVASRLMGDNEWTRTEYVQMHREQPDVLRSLDGTKEERLAALEKAMVGTPAPGRFLPGPDSRASLTAVLLAASDPSIDPDADLEQAMLRQLQQGQGGELLRGRQSREYGILLFGNFMLRAADKQTPSWLFFGCQRDLPATSELAVRVLDESDSVEELMHAFSALVRFKRIDQLDRVREFFDDTRSLDENRIQEGQLVSIRLDDVAYAAAACLLGRSTVEVGFPGEAYHALTGLDFSQLMTPIEDTPMLIQRRAKIRDSVATFLKQSSLSSGEAPQDEASD